MSFLQKSLSARPRVVARAAPGYFFVMRSISAVYSDPNHRSPLVTAISRQALSSDERPRMRPDASCSGYVSNRNN